MKTFLEITNQHGTYPVHRNWYAIDACIRNWERAVQRQNRQAAAENAVQQPLTISEYRELKRRKQAA